MKHEAQCFKLHVSSFKINVISKKLIILVIVIVIVIVSSAVWLGFKIFGGEDPTGLSKYSVVFMTTGHVYYGELNLFPWPKMKNVWFLQRSVNASGVEQLGIAPLNSVFWGPVNEIVLNPQQITFWARLRNDSQVAQAFKNPDLLRQPAASGFVGPTGPPPSIE